MSDTLDGHKFFTTIDAKRAATPLLAALVVIEITDVIFAVDSVPAILAVSNQTFIVLSSNAFAILGLRAMYFLLANARERFHYLSHALGAIMVFVGLEDGRVALVSPQHLHLARRNRHDHGRRHLVQRSPHCQARHAASRCEPFVASRSAVPIACYRSREGCAPRSRGQRVVRTIPPGRREQASSKFPPRRAATGRRTVSRAS